MTLLVVLAALWAAAVFLMLALARAAAGADAQAERLATSLGVPPERPELRRAARARNRQRVVVRWWDPAASYTVEV